MKNPMRLLRLFGIYRKMQNSGIDIGALEKSGAVCRISAFHLRISNESSADDLESEHSAKHESNHFLIFQASHIKTKFNDSSY